MNIEYFIFLRTEKDHFRSEAPLWICLSFTQSLTHSQIFCSPNIIQNNVHRTCLTTYKMFVCFKAPLWTCLSFTQSLTQSFSHKRFFCTPYIIQNNVQITYLAIYKIFVCFKALLWKNNGYRQNTKCLLTSNLLNEPVCPSLSHSLIQSDTNDFMSTLYHQK